jgi:DNA-binding beta-propeller fold protein YncE
LEGVFQSALVIPDPQPWVVEDIAVDLSGNILVAIPHQILVLDSLGVVQRTFGFPADTLRFGQITDLTIDPTGAIWVADGQPQHERGIIYKLSTAGDVLLTWSTNQWTSSYSFVAPGRIAVGADGLLYGFDANTNLISVFEAQRDRFCGSWGGYSCCPPNAIEGRFGGAIGDLLVDGAGRVFVTDVNNARIQVFSRTGVFLFQWGASVDVDGQFSPGAICMDRRGYVYVAESAANRISVFSVPG